MDKMLNINGNLAIAQGERRIIAISAAKKPEAIALRVAAYARVSTSSDEQFNSYAAQNRYYTDLITAHDGWKLVDIYADDTAIMGLNQNPVQTGVDLVPFFYLSALFSANEGVPA